MEPEDYKRIEVTKYGIIMLRTKRFQAIMDRLGRNKISKPAGWFLLYFMPIAAGIGFFLFLNLLGVLFFSTRGPVVANYIRTLGPLSNLGLPGINPYLPFFYGWIALMSAAVIHEGAHGIIARSLGLPVKTAGIFFFLILPLGAFVDVDETAIKEARPSAAARVLAGGAGINFVVGLVFLLLLISVVSSMTPVSNQGLGAVVVADSPLSKAGVKTYDFILAVNGAPIGSLSDISQSSWYRIGSTVNVTVLSGGTLAYHSVTIGNQTLLNVSSGQTFQVPFIGLSSQSQGASDLRNLVSGYDGAYWKSPATYFCLPTIPNCQGVVPFSETLSGFYASPYGSWLIPIANLAYFVFFLNLNLAIFNSLPIYPLDGGQAFRVGIQVLGRGRLSDASLTKITGTATALTVAMVLGAVIGPYLLSA